MIHRYLKNVTTLVLHAERCLGCGKCTEVCPHKVFSLSGNSAHITDKDRCMECGACAQNCPAGAITVNPGVGCASAIIMGWFTKSEAGCDCSSCC
jgi:NAD-dependent dihydropyrimidine dehydrogenase PreA subunit